jgi:hypothetical protein
MAVGNFQQAINEIELNHTNSRSKRLEGLHGKNITLLTPRHHWEPFERSDGSCAGRARVDCPFLSVRYAVKSKYFKRKGLGNVENFEDDG